MHKILEFQAVVLAAGRGSRLPDVGGSVTKCLLPVGPYPVLWYSLNMLEKLGFQETMVVVLDEDKSNIQNALEKCPLKIKYELIVIPSEEDWGTANSLKNISNRVVTDLLVVSGDLITNINLNNVLNLFRKHDAAITALFFNNGPEEWIELPGPKSKSKPDRDLVAIDKETQRLVFLASASDFEDKVTLPRILIKKFDSISMYSRLLDAHAYVMKKWVVDFLVETDKFTSIKGELVPYVVKKQLSKPKIPTEKKGTSEKNVDINNDIFDYAIDHGYESKIREMSAFNDHALGKKGVYYNDILRCYAHIPDKNVFGIRVNTLSAFYLSNNKILSKWVDLTGIALTEKHHPNSEVKTRQIDDSSTVGEKSIVNEKTSIKNTFIGANCTIENKVRLTNCILMNNVIVKEGCVLQDCIIYTGATIETGCSLQYCLVGPHHAVSAATSSNHQLHAEATDNVITLETMVVVLDEDKSNIQNALEKCPLKIKYELIVIPSEEDWGTANSLKNISNRVVTDLLVVSGDLITNINLNNVLNLFRKHDAAITALFFNNGPEEWIELPGPKSKSKPDRDLVAIDKETQRLVFLASASDFEDKVTLPRILIKKFDSISMYSRLLDAHAYVMKKWVVDFLVETDKFTSIKGELVPYVVKKQLSKPKIPTEKKGTSEKNVDINNDIFDYAIDHGYESKIREMSAFNDHALGKKGVYYNDILRCYAHIPDKNVFGIRVNTLSAFYLSNNKILSKWVDLTGIALTEKHHPNSEVKTRQIDDSSTVGEKSIVNEKTSIKNTFIGANCTIENKVRLTNCILMNNVVVKEGCVLQDCIIYTGATIETGCSLQYCLVGPHHAVSAATSSNHQLHAEATDNVITLG